MDITSRTGTTSRTPIIPGTAITGQFVVPGGKDALWSLVTTAIIGQLNIIATDRPPMATGKLVSRWGAQNDAAIVLAK